MDDHRALGHSQPFLELVSLWGAVARTGRDKRAPWREQVLTATKTASVLGKEPGWKFVRRPV